MKVKVERILVGGDVDAAAPDFAVGMGTTDDGTVAVLFAGDPTVMMEAGLAMSAGASIEMDVEDWQVLDVRELGAGPGA